MEKNYVPEIRMDSRRFLEIVQSLMIDNLDLRTEGIAENIFYSNAYSSVIGMKGECSGDREHVFVVASNEDNLRRTIGTLERQSGIKFQERNPWE